jgi:large subunit ribosomal protein L25
MKTLNLSASTRNTFGRKVRQLRKNKLIPANVFGKNFKSSAISLKADDFGKIYAEAGETGLIELSWDGQKAPVLTHNVQMHPVTREVLHVDFHQVNLKEKVEATVPLEMVGEAKAVSDKTGVLLTLLDEVEVEALPADLPEKIEVDVTALSQVGETITAGQLKLPSGVELKLDPETEIIRVDSLVSKEAEAEAAAEEAETQAQAEAAAAETTESKEGGETKETETKPQETDAKKEETKPTTQTPKKE